ncbi:MULTISPECIES: phosphate acyltransferase PlsX [Halopseudomonas]|uniref:phosphate acyltransferase PlsX n=1 Tax=Halopseudomonas TaxID=2901189 RepID=UPI000C5DFB58|nr:phosphate acyltransferase PlsX [Halopseudomonas aestusnigri]MAD27421.1 phosphate acyltransferase [Pseudomonadales bacterium]MCC4260637.1 phosphate acyltransferase PlsX [Halopseudomonas aestusnigri]MCK5533271.1 phosphate acyltransferase PlsX [Halopseudomonas aestusnigri]
MSTSIRIAIDVMGGDRGPRCIVPAALRSLSLYPFLHITLVGAADIVEPLLGSAAVDSDRLSFRPAREQILADDPPASVLRGKRDASMRVALELVRDGQVDGCLSAGNTGALMVLARAVLGTLEGIRRPAIMAALPVSGRLCHVLDLGANVDCPAEQLVEFAIMGAAAAAELSGNPAPRVGLLNIGSETHKGNRQVRQAAALLQVCPAINYVGSVEGDGLFRGEADVVVCDGFVGNVLLKASEGVAGYLQAELRSAVADSWLLRWLAPLVLHATRRTRERHDPARYNGASLLGLRGVVMKSHGSADEEAILAAIGHTLKACQARLPERIAGRVRECGAVL